MSGNYSKAAYSAALSDAAAGPPVRAALLQLFHSQDVAKFFGAEWHYRETRLSNELNLVQRRFVLNLTQRYRALKRTHRHEINSAPVFIRRRRIAVSNSHDFRDPYDRLLLAAVIEKNFVAVVHPAQIISRRVIAHSGPARSAIVREVRPRIGGWFLFHEPEIFHMREIS
jgi:hypothetical protein